MAATSLNRNIIYEIAFIAPKNSPNHTAIGNDSIATAAVEENIAAATLASPLSSLLLPQPLETAKLHRMFDELITQTTSAHEFTKSKVHHPAWAVYTFAKLYYNAQQETFGDQIFYFD
uniref:Uncharacterized protein n=1 Tax=Nelumbo nucifera TaxID=4432 RepID=A0A822YFT3_NELNU|nr:TPA_asm: hypothetical protein HUJ06_010133 [Nelumbo nucifera]